MKTFDNQVKAKTVFAVMVPTPFENQKTTGAATHYTKAQLSNAALVLKNDSKTLAIIPFPVIMSATDNFSKFVLNLGSPVNFDDSYVEFSDTSSIGANDAMDITFEYLDK